MYAQRVRIIAGEFRSRRLKPVPGRDVRPTSDRLRETLFNVLGAAVEGAVFVDGYAGTGAVGLEAISRGAAAVFFLEESRTALRVLEENVAALGVTARAHVRPGPTTTGLRRLVREGLQPAFVFLDPPYQEADEYWDGMAAAAELEGALLIVEHAKRTAPHAPKEWERLRLLEQGDSALSFYRRADKNVCPTA